PQTVTLELTSERTCLNVSAKVVDVPLSLDVDDCISDAEPPVMMELSSALLGVANSLIDHMRETGARFNRTEPLRFKLDAGNRTIRPKQSIRVVLRWRETKRIEDSWEHTHTTPTRRPRVRVEVVAPLMVDARAEMSSHVPVIPQNDL